VHAAVSSLHKAPVGPATLRARRAWRWTRWQGLSRVGSTVCYLSSAKRHREKNKSSPGAVRRHARSRRGFRRRCVGVWQGRSGTGNYGPGLGSGLGPEVGSGLGPELGSGFGPGLGSGLEHGLGSGLGRGLGRGLGNWPRRLTPFVTSLGAEHEAVARHCAEDCGSLQTFLYALDTGSS
jgi:hypothetical protein